jgi:hypothetical protein
MPAAKKKPVAAPARTARVKQPAPLPATREAKPAKAVKPPKAAEIARPDPAEKADKARKPKLVRDSFTIPKTEYAVLEQLKLRAAKLGRPAKKSEVLRAGVMALAAMGDAAFLASVTGVPAVKTGRPAKAAA